MPKQKMFIVAGSAIILLAALTILIVIVWQQAYKEASIALELRQDLTTQASALEALPRMRLESTKAAPYNQLLQQIFSPASFNVFTENVKTLAKKYKLSAVIDRQSLVLTGEISTIQLFLKELSVGPYAVNFTAAEIAKTKSQYTARLAFKILNSSSEN